MKEISLTRGKTALVDDEDFDRINAIKWTYQGNRGYAYNMSALGTKKCVLMHRYIMSPKKNEQIDHINHDKLDNRKSNLRICSNTQNGQNKYKTKNNTSG